MLQYTYTETCTRILHRNVFRFLCFHEIRFLLYLPFTISVFFVSFLLSSFWSIIQRWVWPLYDTLRFYNPQFNTQQIRTYREILLKYRLLVWKQSFLLPSCSTIQLLNLIFSHIFQPSLSLGVLYSFVCSMFCLAFLIQWSRCSILVWDSILSRLVLSYSLFVPSLTEFSIHDDCISIQK